MSEVFVVLSDGLGNQMFQAAFGIAIERRFGADVRFLARRGSRDVYGRRYLLDRFPFFGRALSDRGCGRGARPWRGRR
jgi:hypothetical protein